MGPERIPEERGRIEPNAYGTEEKSLTKPKDRYLLVDSLATIIGVLKEYTKKSSGPCQRPRGFILLRLEETTRREKCRKAKINLPGKNARG